MSNAILDECLVDLKHHDSLSVNLLNKEAVDVLIRRGFARIVNRIDYSNFSVEITEKGCNFEGFVQEEKAIKKNKLRYNWTVCVTIITLLVSIFFIYW